MPDPLPQHPRYVVAVLLLAGAAGLIDAVTYTAHGHVFANAMTGNIVLLGIAMVSHRPWEVLLHVVPILSFIAGVLAGKWLLRFHRGVSLRLTLLIQMAVLVAAGALRTHVRSELLVTALALSSAMQVTTVRRMEQIPFNTTFMTGNLRSVFEGAFDTVFPPVSPGTSPDQRSKRQFVLVGLTCLAFFCGALLGSCLQPVLLDRSFLVAASMLLAAAGLLWEANAPTL